MPLTRARLAVLFAATATAPAAGADALPPTDPLPAAVASVRAEDIRTTIDTLAGFGTRHTWSSKTDPVRGIGAAATYLESAFRRCAARSGGRMTVERDAFAVHDRLNGKATLSNIVATLPGDAPAGAREVYVVSGHYDSRNSNETDARGDAPGADDDASGTAVSLAAACALAPLHFRATLVFLAVAGEEQGLYGAEHAAQRAKAEHVVIGGMFTNDIVGTGAYDTSDRGRRIRLFAEGLPARPGLSKAERAALATGGDNDLPPRTLARYTRDTAARLVPTLPVEIVYRRDRYLRGGDQMPFLDRGYPALRFTEPREEFTHQHQDVRDEGGVRYGDRPEFVDADFVADVARVNVATLGSLALAPARPAAVTIAVSRLENDTTLGWHASPGAVGYRILIRRTTAPDWEQAVDVGPVTSYTLAGRSKDDLLFGVAALGPAGHASVPAYPLPTDR